jgi:hypothetical protein
VLAKEVSGIAAYAGCYLIGAQAAAQLKTGTVKAPVFFGVVAYINRYGFNARPGSRPIQPRGSVRVF